MKMSGVKVIVVLAAALLQLAVMGQQYRAPGILTKSFQGVNLMVADCHRMQAVTQEGDDLWTADFCSYGLHSSDTHPSGLTGPSLYQFWGSITQLNNLDNSTLAHTGRVKVPGFDVNLCGFSRDCIFQPTSQRLDCLAGFTAYRLDLRNFSSRGLLQCVAGNNVDVDGNHADVQWVGFDINTGKNAIHAAGNDDLSGILDSGDSLSRWMRSATLGQVDNIGIG